MRVDRTNVIMWSGSNGLHIKTFVIFLAELLNSQSNELSEIANVCTVSLLIFPKHALFLKRISKKVNVMN